MSAFILSCVGSTLLRTNGRYSQRMFHQSVSLSTTAHNRDDIARVKINKIVSSTDSDLKTDLVKVQGWVRTNRSQKTISFLQINDGKYV
jgi:hypothetical protein